MASELSGLTDLHHRILHLLMSGWQTMDQSKADGIFDLGSVAEFFDSPVDAMREQLVYLESLGLVQNVHSHGVDQTKRYKTVAGAPDSGLDIVDPNYYITENGKRIVVADLADDGESSTAPS